MKISLTILIIAYVWGKQIELTVETKYGKLKGAESTSIWSERPFLEFKGIPYAKPPVENLRFKPPVKSNEAWEGVRDGSKFGPICPQINTYNTSLIEGNEDCLYLNVFVPKLSEEDADKPCCQKLPVLVVIHGGSFQFESGSDYGPEHWMEENMIVVTFNYRLSIFGFLRLPKNQIYGNMGMKDQVMALKWVQENIESFNGDPSRVTIMGVNSGAVSVHLHMLSPMSKALFQQAISQSGTALDPWGMPHKDRTNLISKMLNCEKNVELFDCLQNLTSDKIMIIQSSFNDWFIDPLVPLGPIIELEIEGETEGPEDRFLTESPLKIMTDGKYNSVPWIVGVNSEEGLLHSSDIVTHGALLRVLDWEWEKAAPITLVYPEMPKNASKELSKLIREHYFGNDTFVEDPTLISDRLTNMYSDRYFFRGAHHSAKLHAATKSPVYLYLFNYKGSQSLTHLSEAPGEKEKTSKSTKGVAHYDQVPYFFNTPYFEAISDESEKKAARDFVAIFARFIIDGKPSVGNWKPVPQNAISSKDPLPYNQLGSNPGVLDEPWTNRIKFWDTVLPLASESGKQTIHTDWEPKKDSDPDQIDFSDPAIQEWINSAIKEEL
jgi:carboxylesterase type B